MAGDENKAATRIGVEIFFGLPKLREAKKIGTESQAAIAIDFSMAMAGRPTKRVRMRTNKRVGMKTGAEKSVGMS